MHRLRTQRGKGKLEVNGASEEEQFDRFNKALSEVLARAFAEGRKAGGAAGKGQPSGPIANLVSRQVIHPLRSEISRVVKTGLAAGDTPTAIAERAGDVFRVWKGVRTELLGEGMVYAAYHQGLLDAWNGKKSRKKAWVISSEERHCPGDVCRKNASGGGVPVKAPFPSGHLTPPAHGGCTCTLDATD